MHNVYIGLDRTGTLELPGLPPPAELSERLHELQDEGVRLFIASGKSYDVLRHRCAELKLTPWMYCCENGGHIVIPEHAFETVAPKHRDLEYFARSLDLMDLPPGKPEVKRSIWSRQFDKEVHDAKDIIARFIWRHDLALNVYVHPEHDGAIDVIPTTIDKANLVQYLPPAAVIHYFGDGDNDLGIMRHARVTPHTVSNARQAVRACVARRNGYISDLPAGMGVADMLERLSHRLGSAHA
ncbi:HAD family phosphatase [Trinickia violacea]|uniref:HAD family phosphatase n=1 Tax=Trinickia violacea TaxID=2571746 RepID=A0A4P8IY38_9BURK|nr:HAD hydrolase family protein [Trinickia violacea]QCP53461.1 HAD family phosphatase [Trinickia violacea]